MTKPVIFATDNVSCERFIERVEHSIDLTKAFPQWPFRKNGYGAFFQSLRARETCFGVALHCLAQRYKDDEIDVVARKLPGDNSQPLRAFCIKADHLQRYYAPSVNKMLDSTSIKNAHSALAVYDMVGSSQMWSVSVDESWKTGLLLTPERIWTWMRSPVDFYGGMNNLNFLNPPKVLDDVEPMSDDQITLLKNYEAHSL